MSKSHLPSINDILSFYVSAATKTQLSGSSNLTSRKSCLEFFSSLKCLSEQEMRERLQPYSTLDIRIMITYLSYKKSNKIYGRSLKEMIETYLEEREIKEQVKAISLVTMATGSSRTTISSSIATSISSMATSISSIATSSRSTATSSHSMATSSSSTATSSGSKPTSFRWKGADYAVVAPPIYGKEETVGGGMMGMPSGPISTSAFQQPHSGAPSSGRIPSYVAIKQEPVEPIGGKRKRQKKTVGKT